MARRRSAATGSSSSSAAPADASQQFQQTNRPWTRSRSALAVASQVAAAATPAVPATIKLRHAKRSVSVTVQNQPSETPSDASGNSFLENNEVRRCPHASSDVCSHLPPSALTSANTTSADNANCAQIYADEPKEADAPSLASFAHDVVDLTSENNSAARMSGSATVDCSNFAEMLFDSVPEFPNPSQDGNNASQVAATHSHVQENILSHNSIDFSNTLFNLTSASLAAQSIHPPKSEFGIGELARLMKDRLNTHLQQQDLPPQITILANAIIHASTLLESSMNTFNRQHQKRQQRLQTFRAEFDKIMKLQLPAHQPPNTADDPLMPLQENMPLIPNMLSIQPPQSTPSEIANCEDESHVFLETFGTVARNRDGYYYCPHYPVCNRRFCRKFNLKSHFSSHHIAQRPFVCEKCNVRFSRRSDLRRHLLRNVCDNTQSRRQNRRMSSFELQSQLSTCSPSPTIASAPPATSAAVPQSILSLFSGFQNNTASPLPLMEMSPSSFSSSESAFQPHPLSQVESLSDFFEETPTDQPQQSESFSKSEQFHQQELEELQEPQMLQCEPLSPNAIYEQLQDFFDSSSHELHMPS